MKFLYMLIFLFFIGCASHFDSGISLSEHYINTHNKYESVYEQSDNDTKQHMEENIAPEINSLKDKVINYNDKVLKDENISKKQIVIELEEIEEDLEQIDN